MRAFLLAALLAATLMAGCSDGSGDDGSDGDSDGSASPPAPPAPPPTTPPTAPPATPPPATPATPPPSPPAETPDCSDAADGIDADGTVATLTTDFGCIVLVLEDAKAPVTVENFRTYAEEGFFDGTLFHRIRKDFMIQGGGMGMDGTFKTATHAPITNEARSSGLSNEAYTIAMARTNAPNSATNQFFINHADNTFLDPGPNASDPGQAGYAVFGHVVVGTEVVDEIASVPVRTYQPGYHCQNDGGASCPLEDVVIWKVTVSA